MIQPVNCHVLIEPLVHDSFMASQKESYEEIGIVVKKPATDSYVGNGLYEDFKSLEIGDKVFFDSWLAAKYPNTDGKDGQFYWLVKWEDIRAIEKQKN